MDPIFNRISTLLCIITLFGFSNNYAQSSNEGIEDNITYASSIDGKYVYVELTTADKPTMMSMLHRGFNVYFDIKGKKKKKISIQYPSEITAPQGGPNKEGKEDNNREDKKEEGEQKGPKISVLVDEMPRKAKYITSDSEEEFHLDINNLDISISYKYDTENKLLHFELKMPKRNIANDKTDFSKLSVGIVTPKTETKNEKPSVSLNGGGQGRGSGGQGGGGPPGGGGGRGSQQGGGGPQQKQQQEQRPQKISINFWFKANLIE